MYVHHLSHNTYATLTPSTQSTSIPQPPSAHSALLAHVNADPTAAARYESTMLCTDAYVPATMMNTPTRMMK